MTYAALGLVLYGLRGLTPRAALRVAVCLVAGLAVLLLGYGLLTVASTGPVTPAQYAPGTRARWPPTAAGYRSVVGAHLRELPTALGANLMYTPDMLAAFLAGLAAAKAGLVERRGRDRGWLRGSSCGGCRSAWRAVWSPRLCERAAGQPVVPGRTRGVPADRARAHGVVRLRAASAADAVRPAAARVLAASGRMALTPLPLPVARPRARLHRLRLRSLRPGRHRRRPRGLRAAVRPPTRPGGYG